MRRIILLTTLTFIIFAVFAFKMIDDISERLGISTTTIQNFIISDLTGDFNTAIESYPQQEGDKFKIPYTRMLPSIAAGDKVGAAKELCDYIKLYCNSQQFIDEYNKRRMRALPLSDNGTTVGSLMQNIEVFKTNIANYKTDTKYVAEQQQKLDDAQRKLNALLEKSKQPFPLKNEWDKTYPAYPSVLIKQRLQEYLAIMSTVDFGAALTAPDNHNKRHFVNPAYEKKSLKWKAIYRAGKEVNEVATAWAKDWLKGEIVSKEKITMPDETKDKQTAGNETAASVPADASIATAGDATGSDNTTNTPSQPTEKSKKFLLKKLASKTKSIVPQ